MGVWRPEKLDEGGFEPGTFDLEQNKTRRTLSFLRIMFFPMARISAFSPSLMSSTSTSGSSSSSELDPASGSADASTNPALSAPRRALAVALQFKFERRIWKTRISLHRIKG
jgi:hypothetical protein